MAEAEPHYRSVYSVRGMDHVMLGGRPNRAGDIMFLSTDPRRNTHMRGSLFRNLDQAEFGFSIEEDETDYEEVDDDDDDFFDDLDERLSAPNRPQVLPFPSNPEKLGECAICFETKSVRPRTCCDLPVCTTCVEEYLVSQVLIGNMKIQCLQTSCSSHVHRDEVNYLLPDELKKRYARYLVLANQSPHCKTCPQCSHVRTLSQEEVALIRKRRSKIKKNGLLVECEECHLQWCFLCQAPWHTKMTCREFSAGDKLLKDWSHQYNFGQLNAQKCPKCKIFIQRTTGCDQMTCSKCKTIFCYRCGQRFVGIKLIGNHFSRYSPLGCKYNFLPDRPAARRFIRGAAMSGKLLTGIVLGGLAVAAGAVLLGASVFILPAYGGYRLHKRRRRQQNARILHQRYAQQQSQRGNTTFSPLNLNTIPELDEVGPFIRPPQSLSLSYDDDDDDDDDEDEDFFDEEERDIREREMFTEIGLQLPHSRVTLLRQDTSSQPGSSKTHSQEVANGNVHVTTHVDEEVDEDGYRRLVAHVVSNPICCKSKEKKESSAVFENLSGRKEARASSAGFDSSTFGKNERREGERSLAQVGLHRSTSLGKLPLSREWETDSTCYCVKLGGQLRYVRKATIASRARTDDSRSFTPPSVATQPASLSRARPALSHGTDSDSDSDESTLVPDGSCMAGEDEHEEFDVENDEEEDETRSLIDPTWGRSDESREEGDGRDSTAEEKLQESRKVEGEKIQGEDGKKKADGGRRNDNEKKKENKCKEETKGDKNAVEVEDDEDEKETKGCFTHLIVRKLSSLQVGVTDTTPLVKTQANGIKVTSLNHRKSATWEKRSHRKESRVTSDLRSLDIRALLFQAEKFPDRSNLDTDPREEEKWQEGEVVSKEGGREWKKLDTKSVSDGSFPHDGAPPPGSDCVQPARNQLCMYVSPCDVVTHL